MLAGDRAANHVGLSTTNARRATGLVLALVVLACAMAASLAIGTRQIPFGVVVDALFAPDGSDVHAVVRDLRVPRTVLGLLVGAALGTGGALIQALTRNPLADPGLLGVNAGASLAVVLGVSLLGIRTIHGALWAAFVGAIVATVVVYAIGAAGGGVASPARLVLAGVALAAVLGGIGTAITLLDRWTFDRLRFWGVGDLAGRNFEVVAAIAPFVAVGLVLALLAARPLNLVGLGDDLAASLGAHVVRTRVIVMVAIMLLCGAATAAVGPIGFVGLMVPHVARWIVGPDQRWILAYTVVLSPVLLLVSDLVGRVVLRPGELQVGIVTAFVGAPVLIALVRRRRVSGL